MPIEPWFPLAVYYADIDNAAAHKESLVSTILELEKKGYERRIDSETAWTGDFHGVLTSLDIVLTFGLITKSRVVLCKVWDLALVSISLGKDLGI